ncbi:MAG: 3-mercaptopyruvate sulfurtransferase [Brevundimonas sp.]|uniref:3-mercaptopyruvate sulfurtransferase n=1 Tax=Brevundimonas sp. TaxID=1871086 RepID=UPI002ABA9541|nr:3-mercaptopyruvate sulfurtransferase [Brevundimonas sp.]MDZ4112861.1 3-mercaptopyruvate sulfurtransferase [Brevundimonas sp.]
MSPLIEARDLQALMREGPVRVVDAGWRLDGTDTRALFRQAHIPGAVFFDLEAVSAPTSPLPHTLPDAAHFGQAMGALGLSEGDRIVVYEAGPMFSAPRAWWMLKTFGATQVQVLNGGLDAWTRAGGETEGGDARPLPARFDARLDRNAVADIEAVRRALTEDSAPVLDARGAARFRGESAEPRPGVRPGHMPGARNLPYSTLVDEAGRLRDRADLEAAFEASGLDNTAVPITTCGSGVTAAILVLALTVLGRPARLYDGSWAEWGSRTDTPIQTG